MQRKKQKQKRVTLYLIWNGKLHEKQYLIFSHSKNLTFDITHSTSLHFYYFLTFSVSRAEQCVMIKPDGVKEEWSEVMAKQRAYDNKLLQENKQQKKQIAKLTQQLLGKGSSTSTSDQHPKSPSSSTESDQLPPHQSPPPHDFSNVSDSPHLQQLMQQKKSFSRQLKEIQKKHKCIKKCK